MESRRPFLSDRQNMLDALRRIHEHNEAIYFQNRDETLDFFLRTDPCVDEAMKFELCPAFVSDGVTPTLRRIVDRSTVFNESDDLVYRDFAIESDASPHSLDVSKAMDILNAHYEIRICPCNRQLIKDGHDMCFYCHMTASSDELHKVMCTICHQETPRVTLRQQQCCKQLMHPLCLGRWHHSEASCAEPSRRTCPMCRASSKIF